MMARIIRWKKFSPFTRMVALVCILVGESASTSAALAQTSRMPPLTNVGMIPVRWEGVGPASQEPAVEWVNELFPESIKKTRRFRMLDDTLVSSLWLDVKGRKQLVDQNELDAFVHLSVAGEDTEVVLSARLLSPELGTWLVESDAGPKDLILGSDRGALAERLDLLVFRLVNRLPVDAHVTSVQGAHITLSSGADQGLKVGDQLTVVRAEIAQLHPANGSWLAFTGKKLGQIQIVDVKTKASVAKITGMAGEGAISVGEGVRIETMPSRQRFKTKPVPEPQAHGDAPKVVSPLYESQAPAPLIAKDGSKEPQGGIVSPVTPSDQPTDEPGSTLSTLKSAGEYVTLRAGPRVWSASGRAKASSEFPLWMVNNIGAMMTKSITTSISADYGLDLSFGSISKDFSFLAFELGGGVYYREAWPEMAPWLHTWFAGVDVSYENMTAGGSDFQGLGAFHIGFAGGVVGPMSFVGLDKWDSKAKLALSPLSLGSLEGGGTDQSIKSGFGWLIDLTAMQQDTPESLTWGGGMEFSGDSYSLSGGSVSISDFRLKALGKYRF